jgi:hypothetical protein
MRTEPMDIFLELQTSEPDELRKEIIGEQAAPRENDVIINDQLSLRFAGIERQRAVDVAALVMFTLSFPMGVATNVIADRISDFLNGRCAQGRAERAFLIIEEEIEITGTEGKRTTRTTSRREEISL